MPAMVKDAHQQKAVILLKILNAKTENAPATIVL
jgi:hypothetical protein